MSQVTSSPHFWIMDACSALNLASSGQFEAILRTPFNGELLAYTMTNLVIEEAVRLRRGGKEDDADERDTINWESYFAGGWIYRESEPTTPELASFVQLATLIDDGEAMTLALALSRGYGVVTDDRKAQRMLAPQTFLDTPMLLENWSKTTRCSPVVLGSVLRQITDRSNFLPPRNHALKIWWDKASKG